MKFLVDVNASRTLGQYLTEIGHEVIFVSDRNSGMKDEDILNWAVEETRVILTTDKDFEQTQNNRGRSSKSSPKAIA